MGLPRAGGRWQQVPAAVSTRPGRLWAGGERGLRGRGTLAVMGGAGALGGIPGPSPALRGERPSRGCGGPGAGLSRSERIGPGPAGSRRCDLGQPAVSLP
ncbi:unnamed protein product [Coccothraustes coccothraustes]